MGFYSKGLCFKIALSSTHCLAVTSEKFVYAWGSNAHGQLGFGDTIDRPSPTLVETLKMKAIAKIAAG